GRKGWRWYVGISERTPKSRSSEKARRAADGLERSRCRLTSPRPSRCRRPAKCSSAESSASRSHSRAGAIPASSLRTSSENDTLELQQPALVGEAERAVRAQPVGCHHAVAGNEQREAVRRADRADGPLR